MEIWASMRPEPEGGWRAETAGPLRLEVTESTREACVEALGRAVRQAMTEVPPRGDAPAPPGEAVTIVIEVVPVLAGVAEAAQVMEWDKRRVITYIDRGSFPRPVQALASGRIWLRSDVEAFARRWRERRAGRGH